MMIWKLGPARTCENGVVGGVVVVVFLCPVMSALKFTHVKSHTRLVIHGT